MGLDKLNSAHIQHRTTLSKLVKRPQVSINDLRIFSEEINTYLNKYDLKVIEAADIQIKYEDYIDKEHQLATKMKDLENLKFHKGFDFSDITALSSEAKEKLSAIKPKTICQASRISGVSPADISILMVYMGR